MRPDYVACVLLGMADKPRETWCGRRLSMEFHFVDATHALLNAAQGGRLLICDGCAAAIKKALEAGAWQPAVKR